VAGKILVVGGDLMAHGRIRSAAESTGTEAHFVAFGGLIAALAEDSFDLLIVDLDDGRDPVLDEVRDAGGKGLLPRTVVGYYSHVDMALGKMAEGAGVRPLRRGHFWSSLPSILGGSGPPEPKGETQ
jgi:hypothetical protein